MRREAIQEERGIRGGREAIQEERGIRGGREAIQQEREKGEKSNTEVKGIQEEMGQAEEE